MIIQIEMQLKKAKEKLEKVFKQRKLKSNAIRPIKAKTC